MRLLAPEALWTLAMVPLLWAAWVRAMRPASRFAHEAAGRARGTPALGAGCRYGSVPLLLWGAALAMVAVALGRPHANLVVPAHSARVMLALDVSGSMGATDIGPNRLEAAKAAAKAFVRALPDTVRVGIVSFGERAIPLLEPTDHRAVLIETIDRLRPMQGTSLGSAIGVALATLYPEAHIDPFALHFGLEAAWAGFRAGAAPQAPAAGAAPVIVLLTDGESTTGPPALEAARLAERFGARVYSIGIGTAAGQRLRIDGFTMRVRLDEAMLREVAQLTAGEYFRVESEHALSAIHRALSARLGFEQRYLEVSALFTLAAALFAALATLLSVHRHKRVL